MSMNFRIGNVVIATVVFGALNACNDDHVGEPGEDRILVVFHHEGLDGREITRLYRFGNHYYAATDAGLFSKAYGANQWQAQGLQGQHVLDLAAIDDEHLIASVRAETGAANGDRIVESLDGGVSWEVVAHDFGGDEPETAFGLAFDPQGAALYASGRAALAVSHDEGRSWRLLTGQWGGFAQPKSIIRHNPANNQIWYGGQNAIEQMVLKRYTLDTGEEQSFPDLMPAPSVIYGIQFHPQNDDVVYASGEGGIVKSSNNGGDWTSVTGAVDHRFYFDLAFDPADPERLYTAGWTKNWETPQPLIFEMSTDGGKHWQQYRHPSQTLFGGVRSLLASTEAGATVVYLGLYGGGIMKATVRLH